MIRNSKIENLLILDESKLFIFNRARMRSCDQIIIKFL